MAKELLKEEIPYNDKMPFVPKGIAVLEEAVDREYRKHPDKARRRMALIASPIEEIVAWAQSIDPEFTPSGELHEIKESAVAVILEWEYGQPEEKEK